MTPVQNIQRALDAEVNTLLEKHRVLVLEKIPSTTAVLVGNFIISKSILSPFLKRLGYARGKKPTGVGRLYFKVNNFAEILLSIYYLYILAPKVFKKVAPTPILAIEGIVKNVISISCPVTHYLEFRHKLFLKRCISMGVGQYDLRKTVDSAWINTVKDTCGKTIITSGEAMGVSPAVICIALLEHTDCKDIDFYAYKAANEAIIQKEFITRHYVRSLLGRVTRRFSKNYDILRDLIGFTHADINNMATEYQDNIERILDNTRNGLFIDI